MTLFRYLTEEGPSLALVPEDTAKEETSSKSKKSKKSKRSKSSKSHGRKSLTTNISYMPPLRIIKWEDFNYATLHKMYDHLLSDESINPRHFQIGPSFRRAKNEAGVGDFIQEYNLKVMVEALRETGHLLGRQEFISMARGHSAQLVRRDDGGRNYIPDWAGIRVHGHSFEPTEENPANILPGETKISRAWTLDESQIIENVGERGPYDWPDWFKPFVQIFSYCVELQVRYGYLITDKELVVVRIGPLDRSKRRRKSGRLSDEAERLIDLQRAAATLGHVPSEELRETLNNGVLEYASIRCGPCEAGQLSVNLALWWLHLLALKDNTVQRHYACLADEALGRIDAQLEDSVGTQGSMNCRNASWQDGVVESADGRDERDGDLTERDSGEEETYEQGREDKLYKSYRAEAEVPPSLSPARSSQRKRQKMNAPTLGIKRKRSE